MKAARTRHATAAVAMLCFSGVAQSRTNHGGAFLEQISGVDVPAGRLNVSTTHTSCLRPGAVSTQFGEHATD